MVWIKYHFYICDFKFNEDQSSNNMIISRTLLAQLINSLSNSYINFYIYKNKHYLQSKQYDLPSILHSKILIYKGDKILMFIIKIASRYIAIRCIFDGGESFVTPLPWTDHFLLHIVGG